MKLDWGKVIASGMAGPEAQKLAWKELESLREQIAEKNEIMKDSIATIVGLRSASMKQIAEIAEKDKTIEGLKEWKTRNGQ